MRTKTTSGIADLETPQETLTSNDEEKAEILANFFTSVFTQESLDDIPEVQNKIFEDELQEHKIEPEEVQKMLINLNPTKSSGPDKLHSKTLKELAKAIDKPLAILFQNTLKKGTIPDEWKLAEVKALFKKGDKIHQIIIDQ